VHVGENDVVVRREAIVAHIHQGTRDGLGTDAVFHFVARG
jgi:hypothetical protein